jgi:hypothetical protein
MLRAMDFPVGLADPTWGDLGVGAVALFAASLAAFIARRNLKDQLAESADQHAVHELASKVSERAKVRAAADGAHTRVFQDHYRLRLRLQRGHTILLSHWAAWVALADWFDTVQGEDPGERTDEERAAGREASQRADQAVQAYAEACRLTLDAS